MAFLEDAIQDIADPQLRERISAQVKKLKNEKKFGLVFEEHLPEVVPLYNTPVNKGSKVARKVGSLTEIFRVKALHDGSVTCVRDLDTSDEESTFDISDVVVVKRFGEPIYPTLIPVDRVQRADDKACHVLIEADNYHALQLLEYVYPGTVDCIYIDPPYNTGARDWKYNNDYVDSNDSYRHSKWLSFMRRRLQIAARLLKHDGVLIAMVDDNEVHHLRVLLHEIFPTYNHFVVVIEHNKRGRQGEEFAKTHEYALFVVPEVPGAIGEEPTEDTIGGETRNLRRTGNNSLRSDRPGQFYPVFVHPETLEVVEVGEPIPLDQPRDSVHREGLVVVWPVDKEGVERRWYYGRDRLKSELASGKAFAARKNYGIQIYYTLKEKTSKRYKTVWSRPALDASTYGTELLTAILGRQSGFSFPKSVYATRDCIATVCGHRPNAIVVDFFAGSGTTLNAVALLNAADGGRRQCVLVTNNEVNPAEFAEQLISEGKERGSAEFERHGICQAVTLPRCKFVLNGVRDDGTAIPGQYLLGTKEEKEVPWEIRHLSFVANPEDFGVDARKSLVAALGLTQNKVTDAKFYLVPGLDTAILWSPDGVDDFCEAVEELEELPAKILVGGTAKQFRTAKPTLLERLPARTVVEEATRAMAAGFDENLQYLRLDFLDPMQVEMGRAFSQLLPTLWMMSGCHGPIPKATGEEPFILCEEGRFAVLLKQAQFKSFQHRLEELQPKLNKVFLVTDSTEAFHGMMSDIKAILALKNDVFIQLYRNYLDNFRINTGDKPS